MMGRRWIDLQLDGWMEGEEWMGDNKQEGMGTLADEWLVGGFLGWLADWLRDIMLMLSHNPRKPLVTSGRQQPPGEQPGSQNHTRPAEEDQLFPMCSSVRNAALL